MTTKQKKPENGQIAGMPVVDRNALKTGGSNIVPCPFCGYTAPALVHRVKSDGKLYKAIECKRITCFARGPFRLTASGAIDAWNRIKNGY